MQKEIRTACYDEELHIEAYHFEETRRPFPNHFYDYYVIGFMEAGTRCLSCKNKDYQIVSGDILLFNPGDNHSCMQCDGGALNYRGMNISKETMLSLAEEITGRKKLPEFSKNVVKNDGLNYYLHTLHQMLMNGSKKFEKEEALLFLISELIGLYGQPFDMCLPECREEIELACAYMKQHFSDPVTLQDLCTYCNLSQSTLLRAFIKSKGVTPYRYLQAVRIDKAKNLLKKGVPPMEAGLQTGFSDQRHFSNSFMSFIDLSPAAYRRIFKDRYCP